MQPAAPRIGAVSHLRRSAFARGPLPAADFTTGAGISDFRRSSD